MGKPKRDGDAIDEGAEATAATNAATEAMELVATMRRDLAELEEFLSVEESAIVKKGCPPKRLARLRLVCQDVHSATKFSSRSVKK